MTAAYPLQWPAGFARTKHQEKGKFQSSLPSALNNVQDELRKFGKDSGKPVSNVVISSNYSLGNERPNDPAVAVYFQWDGLPVCIPIDRYQSIQANLQAVAHVISARRTELRHGTLALVRATFTGFTALGGPNVVDWRKILGIHGPAHGDEKQALALAEAAFRAMSRKAHPDVGGSHEKMAELTAAIAQARKELNPGG
jgi:hypothetical protein